MNIIARCLVLLFILCALGCRDNKEEKQADLARHQNSAKVYQEQGQLKAAILEAKKMIQIDADSPAGYLQAGRIYNQIGAYSSAQKLLEAQLKKMPEVATDLAESYLDGKKYLTALNTLAAHPAEKNDIANAQRQARIKAMASFYLGDNQEYEKSINQFTALGGDALERQHLEASVALAQNRIEDAQGILGKILESKPEDIKALMLLGATHAAMQDFTKAESYLTKALGLLPATDIMSTERVRVLSQLTEVLINQGRSSEAYVYQKILADANPESNAAQQRFNDAIKFYQEGKFAEAESILKELREQFPKDKNSATLLGMIEFQKGENEKAANLFDEFIDAETSSPTLIQAAALVKYRKNQIDDALKLLKEAAESQPGNATILATYGLALLDHDSKSKEGAVALEKSLAINPAQQRLRLALAKRNMSLGETDQGLAQLRKAYQEVPLDTMLQEAYFKALFVSGQPDSVKKEVEQFKAKYPDNARGSFLEGWYNMEVKNYAAAEKAFEKNLAVANNAEKKLAYTGLAQLYQIQNQPQKAMTAWQSVIEADPTVSASYGHWLNLMWANNKKDQAFAYLLDLEKKYPSLWQPSAVLAQLYANSKQWADAEKHAEFALSRSSAADEVKRVAANIYQLQAIDLKAKGDLNDARRYFMKAVKLIPDSPDYLANVIEVEIAAKNLAEAQKLLNEYPQNENNSNVRQFFQGAIRFAENKPEEGIKLFVESWKSRPTEIAALSIAEVYEKSGQQEKLNEFIDDWVAKLPKSAKATMFKALQAQKLKRDDEAIRWYEKTIELAPNMAVALNNLAWSYYLAKDERAVPMAKRAYEAAPNSASVLDTYGWILAERGDLALGIEVLTRAASLAGDNADIKNHLKEAKARAK
ncbi:MAG TPA: tetratricopeptide repeat protein [Cellvibrio sp.]|nr:tetratricopeptide repeat protein [Cellvibrio sp.]